MATEQMTLFDIFDIADLPVGHWLTKDEINLYLGEMIPFQDLKNLIGEKIIVEYPRQSVTDYKVVVVTGYYKDHDHSWRCQDGQYVIDKTYDRIGYSDDKRSHKENSWVGEIYCRNGRFDGGAFPECMFAIR